MQNVFWAQLLNAFDLGILTYCIGIFLLYVLLAILASMGISKSRKKAPLEMEKILEKSPLTPGISIIAPAFNESATVISNVRSLLTLNYPLFEVILVNDGSTDDSLEKLIKAFQLVKVDLSYEEKIHCQPVNGFYRSTSIAYGNLLVVDKENGKSKADAVNAGINAASFPYLLNTDVDCILDRNTLYKLIQPFLEEEVRVVAVGGGLRIANSCIVDGGEMVEVKVPSNLLARFQEIEYIRSFSLGKVGWSSINAVPNVSGGLGLFDKEILIKAGGYDPASFGEDMDMIVRMGRYMSENKLDYAIRYVSEPLCWTEVPDTLTIFGRQRTRWARGLFQIFSNHLKVLLNPSYKRMGLITFPYNFFFELLAPIIEFLGWLTYLYLILTKQINTTNALVLLAFVYTFSVGITLLSILLDQLANKTYANGKQVLKLAFTAFLEPFLYHPLIIFFSLKGYLNHLFGKNHQWGNMQRKGFQQNSGEQPTILAN
jgi:cellulose synthase/poly-beta-1,6-N-acetylglucosamine synthase-like glycosyltransferase